jgi:hypothetical protein
MTDIKDRAREYLRGQTQLNGGGLFHCNILNLMLGFAEQETKELEKDKQYFSDSLDKQIEATLKLDKENAELDCQKNRNKYCYSCTNATEKCFKNEIGCPCDKYKSYKDENAELKSENQKWQDEWQEQVQKANEEGYARTLQTIQLSKAKEIIKAFLDSSDLNIKHKAEEFLGEF